MVRWIVTGIFALEGECGVLGLERDRRHDKLHMLCVGPQQGPCRPECRRNTRAHWKMPMQLRKYVTKYGFGTLTFLLSVVCSVFFNIVPQ